MGLHEGPCSEEVGILDMAENQEQWQKQADVPPLAAPILTCRLGLSLLECPELTGWLPTWMI